MCDWETFVRGYLAAGDGGELNALGRYLHDDVVIHDPGGTTAIGIDHEKETWRKARNAMVGLRHEVQEVVCEGSTVAARVELTGSLQGQFAGITGEGQEFKIDQVIFMHLQNGKCKEL